MLKAILNQFSENCYILHDDTRAFIIDPGSNYGTMKSYLNDKGLILDSVLLTHGHYDHISGLNDLLDAFTAPIYIHQNERDFLFDPNLNLSSSMQDAFKVKSKHRIKTFDQNTNLLLDNKPIDVIETPGHTRGSVSFYYDGMLFSGDCLFKQGIGRTDLPTGDQKTIERTIMGLYKTFDDNTVVYPGHGTFTTIAHEKAYNPFIRSAK